VELIVTRATLVLARAWLEDVSKLEPTATQASALMHESPPRSALTIPEPTGNKLMVQPEPELLAVTASWVVALLLSPTALQTWPKQVMAFKLVFINSLDAIATVWATQVPVLFEATKAWPSMALPLSAPPTAEQLLDEQLTPFKEALAT
jgi:hypothetical protein